MHYAEWEKMDSNGYIMYDSTYTTFFNRSVAVKDWGQGRHWLQEEATQGIWGAMAMFCVWTVVLVTGL